MNTAPIVIVIVQIVATVMFLLGVHLGTSVREDQVRLCIASNLTIQECVKIQGWKM